MAPKRKASALSNSEQSAKPAFEVGVIKKPKTKYIGSTKSSNTTRVNGIKGITVAQKSNDPLRDEILQTLLRSRISGPIESKIVFAHTGIYVNGYLFGWVGQGRQFSLRCNNAKQKTICADHNCEVLRTASHSGDNYWLVPEKVLTSPAKLRSLAEAFAAAAPPQKSSKSKK